MNTKKKINIVVLMGGKSAEHDVSLLSAQNIIRALSQEKYLVTPIFISKEGQWFVEPSHEPVVLVPQGKPEILYLNNPNNKIVFDVVFPILHGPFGEDGTIQGLLKLANVPFVGSGVLGSSIGMDKDIMKKLLSNAKIPIGKFITLHDYEDINYESLIRKLHLPLFVKPANLGSSIGISKAKNKNQLKAAIKTAFRYDRKIIIEAYIPGREIECSVLGSEHPKASLPGEINTTSDFYSYDAKYLDANATTLQIPAKIDAKTTKKIQNLAIKTFQTLNCEGLGRVDFFLINNNRILVNEINTLPGFTSASMYPKMWEASGISPSQLVDELVRLAFSRFNLEQKLLYTH